MNREWVTLAFGVLLVSVVAVVSVWQNYPSEDAATADVPTMQAPSESPVETPAQQPATASAPARATSQPAASAPAAPRSDARLQVVHKHRFGDCQGILSAQPGALTYSTDHKEDAFRVAFAEVDAFDLDADKKNLRIRRRGGKTWNFTTRDGGTALTTFHKDATARLRR